MALLSAPGAVQPIDCPPPPSRPHPVVRSHNPSSRSSNCLPLVYSSTRHIRGGPLRSPDSARLLLPSSDVPLTPTFTPGSVPRKVESFLPVTWITRMIAPFREYSLMVLAGDSTLSVQPRSLSPPPSPAYSSEFQFLQFDRRVRHDRRSRYLALKPYSPPRCPSPGPAFSRYRSLPFFLRFFPIGRAIVVFNFALLPPRSLHVGPPSPGQNANGLFGSYSDSTAAPAVPRLSDVSCSHFPLLIAPTLNPPPPPPFFPDSTAFPSSRAPFSRRILLAGLDFITPHLQMNTTSPPGLSFF